MIGYLDPKGRGILNKTIAKEFDDIRLALAKDGECLVVDALEYVRTEPGIYPATWKALFSKDLDGHELNENLMIFVNSIGYGTYKVDSSELISITTERMDTLADGENIVTPKVDMEINQVFNHADAGIYAAFDLVKNNKPEYPSLYTLLFDDEKLPNGIHDRIENQMTFSKIIEDGICTAVDLDDARWEEY